MEDKTRIRDLKNVNKSLALNPVLADMIQEDALNEDRSFNAVIRRILAGYYKLDLADPIPEKYLEKA